MNFFIDYILLNYPGALFSLFLGYTILKKQINDKKEDYNYFEFGVFVKGIGASIGLIIFGLLIIYFKIRGKI